MDEIVHTRRSKGRVCGGSGFLQCIKTPTEVKGQHEDVIGLGRQTGLHTLQEYRIKAPYSCPFFMRKLVFYDCGFTI